MFLSGGGRAAAESRADWAAGVANGSGNLCFACPCGSGARVMRLPR